MAKTIADWLSAAASSSKTNEKEVEHLAVGIQNFLEEGA